MEALADAVSFSEPIQPVRAASAADDGDAALLTAFVRRRDRAALEKLFLRHMDAMYRTACRTCGNSADAEDAVQQAFVAILRSARQYKGPASVRGWMMSIVINACKMKVREEVRRRQHENSLNAPEADGQSAEQRELFAKVLAAMQQLPEHYRTPIWLRYHEGFSNAEVAAATGAAESTIYSQIDRGIGKLKQLLGASAVGSAGAVMSTDMIVESLSMAPHAIAPAKIATAAISTALTGQTTSVLVGIKLGAIAAAAIAAAVGFVLLAPSNRLSVSGPGPGANAVVPRPELETAGEKGDAPAPKYGPSAHLLAELGKKIDVSYTRRYGDDILNDLQRRSAILVALPGPLTASFVCTLDAKQITLKEALEKVAAAGELDIEYRDDTVAFWKKADDKLLQELEQKYTNGDEQARCEAISDLTRLADKRIYPIIFRAFSDKSANVINFAVGSRKRRYSGLWSHIATMGFSADARSIVPRLMELYEQPPKGVEAANFLFLCGATRSTAGADAVLKINERISRTHDVLMHECVVMAASFCRDSRISDLFLSFRNGGEKTTERMDRRVARLMVRAPAGYEPKLLDATLKLIAANAAPAPAKTIEQNIAELRKPNADLFIISHDLANSHDPAAYKALAEFLNSADEMAASTVTTHLGNAPDPQATSILAGIVRTEGSKARINSIHGLMRTRDPQVVETLIAVAADRNEDVRLAALENLAKIGGPTASSVVMKELKAATGAYRKKLLTVVLSSVEPRFIPLRFDMLTDADDSLRRTSIRNLQTFRHSRALDILLKQLQGTPAVEDRVALATAIPYFLEDPRAIDASLKLTRDDQANVRQAAAFHLGCQAYNAPQERVRDRFIELLSDPVVSVASNAPGGLKVFMDVTSVSALTRALQSPEFFISAAAENALDQMKETSTGALKETIAAALAQHREKKKNAEPPRAPQNPTPGDF